MRAFVKKVNKWEIDISRAKFASLDEWVGLSAEAPGSCGYFLRQHLFEPLERSFAEVFVLSGAAEDLELERARHAEFIPMHGSLEFTEDGVDFSLNIHNTPLSPTTKKLMANTLWRNSPLPAALPWELTRSCRQKQCCCQRCLQDSHCPGSGARRSYASSLRVRFAKALPGVLRPG